jgi:hypothetical protein
MAAAQARVPAVTTRVAAENRPQEQVVFQPEAVEWGRELVSAATRAALEEW